LTIALDQDCTCVIRDRGAPGSDLIAVHNELIIPKKLEKS